MALISWAPTILNHTITRALQNPAVAVNMTISLRTILGLPIIHLSQAALGLSGTAQSHSFPTSGRRSLQIYPTATLYHALALLLIPLSLASFPLAIAAQPDSLLAIARRSLQSYPTTPIPSRATFYGGPAGEDTFHGACGYGRRFTQVGIMSAAASVQFYARGAICGACYKVNNVIEWNSLYSTL